MTMEKLELCVRWPACRGSPSSMLQARRTDQVDVYFLFKWQRFCQRTTWIADSFRKRPCAMYKDNAVGNFIAETVRDWDYGATERSFNAVSTLCVAVERRGSTLP